MPTISNWWPPVQHQPIWVQCAEPQIVRGTGTVWRAWQTEAAGMVSVATPAVPIAVEAHPHSNSAFATYVWLSWQTPTVAQPLTPRRDQQRERIIATNRGRSVALRRRVARRTAERLLLEHLSPRQRDEWAAGQYFTVHTADGLRAYRIQLGLAGNVTLVKCEAPPPTKANQVRLGARFCAHVYHPGGWIPDEDNVLAQKLLLESEGGERRFLTMANVS